MPRAINGAALREIRSLLGLSTRELARRCDVNETTVSSIELGRQGVSPELMRKLADTLGVPLAAITIPLPEKASA